MVDDLGHDPLPPPRHDEPGPHGLAVGDRVLVGAFDRTLAGTVLAIDRNVNPVLIELDCGLVVRRQPQECVEISGR